MSWARCLPPDRRARPSPPRFKNYSATPIEITLSRAATSDGGTRGVLQTNGFRCHSLELPWRDNRSNVSRIPVGTYQLTWIKPRRAFSGFTELYWIHDVPGRVGILIHPGTLAGDRLQGMLSDSWGCILLGSHTGTYQGQPAVFGSRRAVREFHDFMQKQPATLIIEDHDA